MLIHDLDFFDLDSECSSDSAIKGGAIAIANSDVYTSNGSVSASASAVGVGDRASAAVTGTRALSISQKYYSVDYGVAYAASYAVDSSYNSASDVSYSYGSI